MSEQRKSLRVELEQSLAELKRTQFKLQSMNTYSVSNFSGNNNLNQEIMSQDMQSVIHKDFDLISHSHLDLASKIDPIDDKISVFSGVDTTRNSNINDIDRGLMNGEKSAGFNFRDKRKNFRRLNQSFNSPASFDSEKAKTRKRGHGGGSLSNFEDIKNEIKLKKRLEEERLKNEKSNSKELSILNGNIDFDIIKEETSEDSEVDDYYEFEEENKVFEKNGKKIEEESLIPYSRIKHKERKSLREKGNLEIKNENEEEEVIGCVNKCSLI